MGLLLLCFGSEKKLMCSESFQTKILHTPRSETSFGIEAPQKLFTFCSCPQIGDFLLKTPVLSFAFKTRIKDVELNKTHSKTETSFCSLLLLTLLTLSLPDFRRILQVIVWLLSFASALINVFTSGFCSFH